MKIVNKVRNVPTISWSKLKKYEFNDLKDENRDVTNLKNSIVNDGFSYPFYIWADHRYVIDGQGRNIVLTQLEEEGYEICDLPFVEIEAETKMEAKLKAMQASSSYGRVTQASFEKFTVEMDVESFKDRINFDDLDFDFNTDYDYSVLNDNEEVDNQMEDMSNGVKKAIQIEFEPEDYEKAQELVKQHRAKGNYIGSLLIAKLEESL